MKSRSFPLTPRGIRDPTIERPVPILRSYRRPRDRFEIDYKNARFPPRVDRYRLYPWKLISSSSFFFQKILRVIRVYIFSFIEPFHFLDQRFQLEVQVGVIETI